MERTFNNTGNYFDLKRKFKQNFFHDSDLIFSLCNEVELINSLEKKNFQTMDQLQSTSNEITIEKTLLIE